MAVDVEVMDAHAQTTTTILPPKGLSTESHQVLHPTMVVHLIHVVELVVEEAMAVDVEVMDGQCDDY